MRSRLAHRAPISWVSVRRSAELLFLGGLASVLLCALVNACESPSGSRGSGAHTLAVALGGATLALAGFAMVRLGQSLREVHGLLSQSGPSADRARRHYNQLIALLRITRLLGASAHLQEILDGISRIVLEIFGAEQTSILLLDEHTQDLELRSAAGLLEEDLLGVRQHLGQGIAGQVAITGEPVLLSGMADQKQFSDLKKKPYSISDSMVVPIRVREELIGVLCVGRRTPGRTYDAEDLQMLQIFAEVVAICIRRTQQALWMQETIHRFEGLVSGNRPAA